MLRIERGIHQGALVLKLSGRLRAEDLLELQSAIDDCGGSPRLDLEEVSLLDRVSVHFLILCESQGIEIVNCALYVREWIFREKLRSERIAGNE